MQLFALAVSLAAASLTDAGYDWAHYPGLRGRLQADSKYEDRPNRQNRIAGGWKTTIQDYPHFVTVERSQAYLLCAGSILSETWILSAFHCTEPEIYPYYEPTNWNIRAGSDRFLSGGETRPVLARYAHPKATLEPLEYDVVLLFIDPPLTYNDPTILPTSIAKDFDEGVTGYVCGFGRLSLNETNLEGDLRAVTFPVNRYNSTVCKSKVTHVPPFLAPRLLCGGETNTSSCLGDSGGPLVVANPDTGYAVQVGIVSFGTDCGADGQPSIFTNLLDPEIRSFINLYINIE